MYMYLMSLLMMKIQGIHFVVVSSDLSWTMDGTLP